MQNFFLLKKKHFNVFSFQYNLDYPDFYTKLYELFTVEIFFVKYKVINIYDDFIFRRH